MTGERLDGRMRIDGRLDSVMAQGRLTLGSGVGSLTALNTVLNKGNPFLGGRIKKNISH